MLNVEPEPVGHVQHRANVIAASSLIQAVRRRMTAKVIVRSRSTCAGAERCLIDNEVYRSDFRPGRKPHRAGGILSERGGAWSGHRCEPDIGSRAGRARSFSEAEASQREAAREASVRAGPRGLIRGILRAGGASRYLARRSNWRSGNECLDRPAGRAPVCVRNGDCAGDGGRWLDRDVRPVEAAASAAQKLDADYTAKIKAATADPRILTELVDHMPASDKVPSPLKFFGYIPGEPGHMTYYKDIARYLDALDKASDRVTMFKIGVSDEGRDMFAMAVADEATIKQLDKYVRSPRSSPIRAS